MFSISRATLSAILLTTSVTLAQAQTTSEQDHQAHHPQAPGGQVQTPPTMGRNGQGRGMTGMMQSGRGPAMMGRDMSQSQMMEMMGRMMAACQRPGTSNPAGASLFSHLDGQLAYYKAELRITDAQLPQWNAFADVARASVNKLQPAYIQALQVGGSASEQLDRRMTLQSVLIETEKEATAPLKALYAVLSPEQQKAADEMLAEHLQAMRAAGL